MTRACARAWLLAAVLGGSPWIAPALAQPAEPVVDVDTDPVRCWWRTDRGAIRAGEPFGLLLTCAVVETDTVRVVVDRARLEPSVLTLPPFDVAGGTQPADTTSGVRRFFQYHYELRLLNENAIGRDLLVPELTLGYRIETRTDGETLQGRDQSYQVPPIPLRVVSLVATDANDIREPDMGSFARVEARALQARVLRIAAIALYAVAALLAFVAVRRAIGERGQRSTEPARVGDATVIAGASAALARAREALRVDPGSDEARGAALTALRVLAAYATGQVVSQSPAARSATPAAGQLLVGGGPLSGRAALVTASATAESVARHRAAHPGGARDAEIEALGDALALLTRARFGADDTLDTSALDAALGPVAGLAAGLAREHGWVARQRRAAADAVAAFGARVWTR
ncbi:MAG: hypothetical protein ACLGHP_03230 [Vicinamibacteria bacterium]